MIANFEAHGFTIHANHTLESCTGCPFWSMDMTDLATGMCLITGTEIPAGDKPDRERMKDCPVKIRKRRKRKWKHKHANT